MSLILTKRFFAAAFLAGAGSLVACAAGDTQESLDDTDTAEDVGTASQAIWLGSAVGSPVYSAPYPGTCPMNNGVTPMAGCTPSSNAPDISFVWTAPYAGTFTFTTDGSGFDSILIIAPYSNPSNQLACKDAKRSNSGESISWTVTAGQQLILTIDGYASLCGPYKINIKPPVCIIGGQTYTNGQQNPSNPCQKCNVTQSTTAWSNNDGQWVQAGGGGYCKYNTCIAGGCSGEAYCSTHGSSCDGYCSGGAVVTSCDPEVPY